MHFRRTRHSRDINLPEVNVIPLIDVSLMLLVVFMVTTPLLQHGIKLELPKGKVQEVQNQQQDLTVFVDKRGHLYCNETRCATEKQVLEELKKQRGAATTVFVKADTTVPYGRVLELVDQIKCVEGVKYVALATTRRS